MVSPKEGPAQRGLVNILNSLIVSLGRFCLRHIDFLCFPLVCVLSICFYKNNCFTVGSGVVMHYWNHMDPMAHGLGQILISLICRLIVFYAYHFLMFLHGFMCLL